MNYTGRNKKFKLINKLVYMLIIFVVLFGFNNVYADPLCKRASNINNTFCYQASVFYTSTNCINNDYFGYGYFFEYGNLNNSQGGFNFGDVFICDINQNGIYDDKLERFYYINDYYDTDDLEFNHDYAVLQHSWPAQVTDMSGLTQKYNTSNYSDSSSLAFSTFKGPDAIAGRVTLAGNEGISLIKQQRQILNGDGEKVGRKQSGTGTFNLPIFDYKTYSRARLLTIQEFRAPEFDENNPEESYNWLKQNAFLLENTSFVRGQNRIQNLFYENYADYDSSASSHYVYSITEGFLKKIKMYQNTTSSSSDRKSSAKPVIEVLKTDISLTGRNSYLKSLNVDGYQLEKNNYNNSDLYTRYGFSRYFYDYSIEVEPEMTSLDVDFEVDDPLATATISDTNNLSQENNVITITVTAESGETSIYTINVNFVEYKTYLTNISISGHPLNETFVKTKTNYTMNMDGSTNEVYITATPEYPNTEISGTGHVEVTGTGRRVELIVTSLETGKVKIYTIDITRELDNNLNILAIGIGNGHIVPEFDNNINEYYIMPESSDTKLVDVNVNPSSNFTTVEGNEVLVLSDDLHHVITLTAEDGTTRQVHFYHYKSKSYDYTGDIQRFVNFRPGKYKLETWGAQGGNYRNNGGYGAYSVGYIDISSYNNIFYVYVGGQPDSIEGGFNGGGNGGDYGGQKGFGGGGATHIATETGLLTTFENKQDKLLIVAGGGSGGGHSDGWQEGSGSGGGKIGADGWDFFNNSDEMYIGTGGTQAGGGICMSDQFFTDFDATGSFGKGGNNFHTAPEEYGGPGGGGGYYGGGGSNRQHASAGGGSGYIGNSSLYDKKMVMYTTSNNYISNDVNTKTEITQNVSSTPTADYAKAGNGYARITLLNNDATLSSLSVGGNEIELTPNNNYYSVIIDDTDSVVLSATTTDPKATISYNQNVAITGNHHVEEIVVTAEDGTEGLYTIDIDVKRETYLKSGSQVRNLLSNYGGTTSFRKGTQEEYQYAVDNSLIYENLNINADYSTTYPVYIWKSVDNELLYYSEANVIYMSADSGYMFSNMAYMESIDISGLNTSNVYNFSGMFSSDPKLTSINFGRNFDTSNATDMAEMFWGDKKLQSIDTTNFNTSKVNNMRYMFSGCNNLELLDVSHFDTSQVTDMSNMFKGLSLVEELDVSHFNTSNVTSMVAMFDGCYKLQSLDVSSFNTSKVTDMSSMFSNLRTITTLNLDNFDTSQVTQMGTMFYNNKNLLSLDLSNFDTSKVTWMYGMFTSCEKLEELDLSSWKVYNVENMAQMFYLCKGLTRLDLSSFDISKVNDTSYMFATMYSLEELDISNFDTSTVINMSHMFDSSNVLETIYVSELFNTSSVQNADGLFRATERLVGQNGTVYSDEHIGLDYAIVDDAPDHPGYLSYRKFEPTITHPEYQITVDLYSDYTIPEGYPVEAYPESTVTLNPNYDGANLIYRNTEIEYTFNKWRINDDEYSPNDVIVVNKDIELIPTFIETIIPADLSPIYRENYKFAGWYTEPEGGELVEVYDNTENDITLYAHWTEAETIPVTTPDEVIYVPYGEEYNLGVNDLYQFYSEAEYVWLDYNLGDGGDAPMTMMAEYLKGNGWRIGDVHYDDNSVLTVTEPITIERDNIIDKPPFVLPKPTNGNKYFAGWYTYGNFNSEPVEVYYGGGDVTFVAKWIDDPVNLTIDGKTKVVERGYVHTVPNAIYDPSFSNDKITIHLDYMDDENTYKNVNITYGYGVDYQLINGSKYNPGNSYVVNEDTTINTIKNWNNAVAMDPYITEPTKDGFVFMGWQLYNWEYYDTSDINVDIYSLTPNDVWYDGATFYAEWQQYDPETQVIVRFIDEFKKQDYSKVYDKGDVLTFEDKSESNTMSINVYNNQNDSVSELSYTTERSVYGYYVNDDFYNIGDTYTLTENVTIKVEDGVSSYHNCNDDYCDLVFDTPGNRWNGYVYEGVYTNSNYNGYPIKPYDILANNTYYGSQLAYNELYLKLTDTDGVILNVDGVVSIIPKGIGTVPGPGYPIEDEYYTVTYKYQDGMTPDEVRVITNKHVLVSMNVEGTEYNVGDEYDYQEDTYIYSNYDYEYVYTMPVVSDEHFLGWYDSQYNGNQVTSLDDVWNDITLYGSWDYPNVHVIFEGEDIELPYGFTVDLNDFTSNAHYDNGATITVHNDSGEYDGDVKKLTKLMQPASYYRVNYIRYDKNRYKFANIEWKHKS